MDFEVLGPAIGVMSGLGLLFGVLLAYASKRFHVDLDARVEMVNDILPGLNCGICGFTGCTGFAEGVVQGEAEVSGCAPGGADVAGEIAEVMGVIAPEVERVKAYLACQGGLREVARRYEYVGYADCHLAAQVAGGPSACGYACLGFGSCVPTCPFDLIRMNDNGLPEIDLSGCTGCGNCVEACPRDVLVLLPEKSPTPYVACTSQDPGKIVRQVCSVGCIACKICERVCPVDAISMDGNLAIIDPEVCNLCGDCIEKCPTKCILSRQLEVLKAVSQQEAV